MFPLPVCANAANLSLKAILEVPKGGRIDLLTSQADDEFIQISAYRPDEVVVRIDAYAPGLLVLNDVYYPGWKAYVDDAPARLLRANGVMRAVPVMDGRHWVRMVFEPASFRYGCWISGLTLFLLAMLAFRGLLLKWSMIAAETVPANERSSSPRHPTKRGLKVPALGEQSFPHELDGPVGRWR